ncbi:MAG TPA: NAD(P)H-dependent glycerol-3-phosphate dehydrogenase [Burkholderiales bacterium]|nr:NAD(P)H-dependent glycerol-3-phosphate dehydrogenase [Burkholderiales bacterium]
MRIGVLGAGAWGSALAIAFSERHEITVWDREAKTRAQLRTAKHSPYLPEAQWPASIGVRDSIAECLADADVLLVVTPTEGLRDMAEALRISGRKLPLIWACKGFEASSSLLPHQVVDEVMGGVTSCAALSGPSFANEVAAGKPTALTLAARDSSFARSLALQLHQPRLRVYFSDDLVGVEVGGAVKNVMAIATGIADGLSLGLNARAALMTRGLAEIMRLGLALGGKAETFMGLTGLGDLVLTCTGDLSRNRRVGLGLGQGEKLETILAQLGHVAEGVNTSREVERRAKSLNIDMPITSAVCDVLFRNVPARTAVEQLLSRDPKSEHA